MSTCVLKVRIICISAALRTCSHRLSRSSTNGFPALSGTVVKEPPPSTLALILVESLFRAFCWSAMASMSEPPMKRPGRLTFFRITNGYTSGL